jgi:hypothetical protein
VDNQAGFLEAFGSAFATGVPGHVNAKELHSLAHDREAGVLEDTAMLGDTAVVNRTEVGKPREIVAPDGSTKISCWRRGGGAKATSSFSRGPSRATTARS